MTLKRTSRLSIFFALLTLIVNAFFLVQVYQSHNLSIIAQIHRQEAMLLVHELRLQTNQLTQLVRTYTTTGEPRYLLYYYDILAIRQGEKPAPAGYLPPKCRGDLRQPCGGWHCLAPLGGSAPAILIDIYCFWQLLLFH